MMELDVEKLFTIAEALWNILKEQHGYTDDNLAEMIQNIGHHDSSIFSLDRTAGDPKTRFKYFATEKRRGWSYTYRTSADGIHWSEPVASKRIWGDRSTVFYNPFRKVWCLSQRIHGRDVGRARGYMEDPDPGKLVEKISYNQGLSAGGESVFWTNADDLDPRNPLDKYKGIKPQLYNVDADGKVIEPFTLANCGGVSRDKTVAAVTWKAAANLAAVSGKPVRFRFRVKNGSIYSFWVSPDKSGASHGYVAAGGPGFTGPTDTVGQGKAD